MTGGQVFVSVVIFGEKEISDEGLVELNLYRLLKILVS